MPPLRSPFIETLQSLQLNLFVDSNKVFIRYLIEFKITSIDSPSSPFLLLRLRQHQWYVHGG